MSFNYIGIIAGSILLVFFIWYIIRRNGRKKRAAEAAGLFTNKVLAELEGVYPITKHWEKEVFDKCRESISEIESATAEFRHFLPDKSKESFDSALKNYCDHCNEMTWASLAVFNIFPGKAKPGEEGPKEIFRQNVNALLSFTKKEEQIKSS